MAEESTPSKPPVAVLEYEPTAFENLLIHHKPKIILVAVLAIGGTVAYWGQRLWTEHKQKDAALAFVRAGTVAELKEVAAKHGTENGAGNALIQAAALLSAERPGEAVDTLKDFLAKFPQHPLRDLASFRIGDYLLQTADQAGAEKELEAVAGTTSPYAPLALLRLGDLKWGSGDLDAAKKYYDRILTTPAFAGTPIRAQAEDRVTNKLKQKPPVLVEYVPEPTPTPGAPDDGTPGADPAAKGFNVDSLLGPTPGEPAADPAPAELMPAAPTTPESVPPTPAPDNAPAAPATPEPAAPASPEPAPAPTPPPAPDSGAPAAPAPAPAEPAAAPK